MLLDNLYFKYILSYCMWIKVVLVFQLYDNIKLSPEERADKRVAVTSVDHSAGGTKAVVEFSCACQSILENQGSVRIGIKRKGRMDIPCTVQ